MADLLGTEEMRLEDNDALDLVTDLAKRANLLKPKKINSKGKIIFLSTHCRHYLFHRRLWPHPQLVALML